MSLDTTQFNPIASITPQLFRAKNTHALQLNDLQKRVHVPPPPPFIVDLIDSARERAFSAG
jgi:hypothetical protein